MTSSPGSPLHSRRWIFGVSTIVVSVVLPPFLVGALSTRIADDMAFDARRLGLSLAACYAVPCVLSPAGGWLVSRLGANGALRLAGGLTTLGLVAIAAATRAEHVMLALALIGAPNALTQPASNEVLARVQAPRLRALSFGLVQASIPTATLVAGAVLAVASYGTSWRLPVLVLAALTVVAQVVLPRSLRSQRPSQRTPWRTPWRTSWRSPARRERRGDRPIPAGHPAAGAPFMAAVFASGCLASGAATALPSFTATTGHAAGLAPWLVAGSQVAGSLASIAVRIVAPVATSHSSLTRRLRTVAGLQAVGLVAMLALATGTAAGFLLGTVAAFGFGWGWNGLYNLTVAAAQADRIASATGITQAGIFLGSTIGPLLFAASAHLGDYRTGWLTMATMMTAAAVAASYAAHQARRASTASVAPDHSVGAVPALDASLDQATPADPQEHLR